MKRPRKRTGRVAKQKGRSDGDSLASASILKLLQILAGNILSSKKNMLQSRIIREGEDETKKILLAVVAVLFCSIMLVGCASAPSQLAQIPTNQVATQEAVAPISTGDDYRTYFNGVFMQEAQVDSSSQTVLDLYNEYENSQLSLDLLHVKVQGCINVIDNSKASYGTNIPAAYKDFDAKASTISNSEYQAIQQISTGTPDQVSQAAVTLVSNTEDFSTLSDELKQTQSVGYSGLGGIILGSKYEDVISEWGQPNRVNMEYKNGAGALNFNNDNNQVTFMNGRMEDLDVALGDEDGVSQTEADKTIKELLPTDSKYIRQYKKDTNTISVYKSQWLSNLFAANDFYDNDKGRNQPGMFIVMQSYTDQGQVFDLMLAAGNNP